jgi:hypothetical protein
MEDRDYGRNDWRDDDGSDWSSRSRSSGSRDNDRFDSRSGDTSSNTGYGRSYYDR